MKNTRIFLLSFFFLLTCFSAVNAGEIHDAVRKGDLARVKAILEKNPGVINEQDTALFEMTPLETAVSKGNAAMVRLLLKLGANVNYLDNRKRTPLFYAGNVETIKILLEAGADINARDDNDETPLHCAVHNEKIAIVKYLIDNGADIEARENFMQLTPLLYSVFWFQGKEEVVSLLLIECGADITKKDKEGNTTLHLAAKNNSTSKIVAILLLKDADVNVRNNNGELPVDLAKEKENENSWLMLSTKGILRDLFCLATLGDMHKVYTFISQNPDIITAKNSEGITPLHFAAITDNLKLAKLLLLRGADIHTKDYNGRTPLYWAARETCPDIVDLLVKKGADVNATDLEGLTPLHCVARWSGCDRSKRITEILLKAKAKPEIRDKYGRTPLHWAAYKNTDKVLDLLLSVGANVDAKDNDGKTPAFFAIMNGHDYLAEALYEMSKMKTDPPKPRQLYEAALKGDKQAVIVFLDKYPDLVNARFHGVSEFSSWEVKLDTPLHAAAENGHNEVAELLITKYKADINAINNQGESPLNLALWNEKRATAILFIKKGANVNFTSKGFLPSQGNWTPLHYAAEKGYADIVELLLKKGANPNIKTNKDGKTPLSIAKRDGHKNIIELLIKYGAKE